MNSAIGYIRISNKDQSNFSLDGQFRYISEHCKRNDIILMDTFVDDGKSAKNFDRPSWKALEAFIKIHHQQVNYLVVVKYDRFSRNAAKGLEKISELEKKYNIIIISVFEMMFADYDSPFFFKQRADMLVAAEFEWHVIRDRTKFGIFQATSSGRYITVAPVGYKNSRDEENKPIILINEEKADHIRRIFQQYLSGHSFSTIAKDCRENGLMINGRTGIPYILNNPVYAGFVKVNAYRKEPARIVKGIHQPIIDLSTWHNVQRKLQTRANPKVQISEEVPLRAQVDHTCGKKLTAGKSTGRRKQYWYYKCNYCPKTNFSAITMHKKFNQLMEEISFQRHHIEFMIEQGEKEMQEQLADRSAKVRELNAKRTDTMQRLESLEEKYITDQIQADTYNRFYSKYSSEIASLQSQIHQLTANQKQKWEQFRSGINRLENVLWLWQNSTLLQKHEFIRLVFNSSLQYDGKIYRTPYLLSLFHHNILSLKEKSLLLVEEAGEENVKTLTSAPAHTPIEHLTAFITLINNIKTA